MFVRSIVSAALLFGAAAATADVRGPDGERGFHNVYPVAASVAQTDRLYRADLKDLAHEAARLEASDGGSLSDDHRAYLETRRELIDRRYADAVDTADGQVANR